MEPEISPEPTADERRAILAALDDEEPVDAAGYRGRWREAALEEGVSVDMATERDAAIAD
ncbi:MAG TPA: hypothetical protein VE596_18940 [Gaiellaceae bacterium]|jgi:hypothetical protein|nr:hypothetical protein [Gaiellaceae bacterium]